MRSLLIASIVLICAAMRSTFAQAPTVHATASEDDRLLAINTVARHRVQMLRDSTRIDGCSIQLLIGREGMSRLGVAARSLVLDNVNTASCRAGEVYDDHSRRLIFMRVSKPSVDTLLVEATQIDGELFHQQEYWISRDKGGYGPFVTEQRLSGFMRIHREDAPPPRRPPPTR